MSRFTLFAAAYYAVIKFAYKICALYAGWFYPGFMSGWYDLNHRVIRGVPEYGLRIDNIARDNFTDGDLVFWELWFGIGLFLGVLHYLVRSAPR
ncbi:MAG: hypothetical protein AAB449_01130 [Patescibacteria group bacterium]